MSFAEKTILSDRLGLEPEIGTFGELRVAEFVPQLPISFDRPINPRQLNVIGTVSAQYKGSLLRVQQNGTIETRDALRYLEGETVLVYFTAAFKGTYSAGADVTCIGCFDSSDGVFLGFQGDQFVVGYRNIYADGVGNGPDVLQVLDTPVDVDLIHRYRIRYGYLGVGNITFERKTADQWEVLHVFNTDGALSERTHAGSTIIPMRAQCGHAGCEILSGSWVAGTYGEDRERQEVAYFNDGERTVSGNVVAQPLVAFRSKTVNGNRPNKVRSQLLNSELATGSEGLYKFEIYQFPAGTLTSGAWIDVDTSSVLEVNETFTEAAALGEKLLAVSLPVPSQGAGVAVSVLDYAKLGIRALPGEEFGIYKRELIAGAGNDLTSWSIAYSDLY